MNISPRYQVRDISNTEYCNIVFELENDLARELYEVILSPKKCSELIKKIEEASEVTFSRGQVNFMRNRGMIPTVLLDHLVTDKRRISILQGNLEQFKKGGRNKIRYQSYYLKTEIDRALFMKIFDTYITEALSSLEE